MKYKQNPVHFDQGIMKDFITSKLCTSAHFQYDFHKMKGADTKLDVLGVKLRSLEQSIKDNKIDSYFFTCQCQLKVYQ